jgi:vancomycin resistance protein YoaR
MAAPGADVVLAYATLVGSLAAGFGVIWNTVRQKKIIEKVEENTDLTATAAQGTEKIASLVNGTQSHLLQKVADLQMTLNSKYAEIRSLQALNASLTAHLDDARHSAPVEGTAAAASQDRRDAQQDKRDERQDQREIRQAERSIPLVPLQALPAVPSAALAAIAESTQQTATATTEAADTLKQIQQDQK